jgi:hypothetical protein
MLALTQASVDDEALQFTVQIRSTPTELDEPNMWTFGLDTSDVSAEEEEFQISQWIFGIICTAMALQQGSVQSNPTQVLWQAARLRILERTSLLGRRQKEEPTSLLEAIHDTQRMMQGIADADVNVNLSKCLFVRYGYPGFISS